MEEVKSTETKSNYIELSDNVPGGNIFSELSGDLGDLDFGENPESKVSVEKDYVRMGYTASSIALTIIIVIVLILGLDTYIRGSDDNSFFSSLPFCSAYLAMGTEWYDNTDCKTPRMIVQGLKDDRAKLEKSLLDNLIIYVPAKIQIDNIISSPKVQFIQERTGDNRLSIVNATARFLDIKASLPDYRWEDVECKTLTADEKGILSVSCDVYGGALIVPPGTETKTSREKALVFLDMLGDMKNGFQITAYPKSLDINQYNTTDGLKSLFSTKTSIDLKLQYLPANKM